MTRSRLNTNDIISEMAEIAREMDAEKTPQFIGSSQIMMKLSAANSAEWDTSVVLSRPGQALDNTGWNVLIVTARSKNDGNLVGRLAIKSTNEAAIGDIISIPLPPSQNNVMKWFIPIFGQRNEVVRLKFQIVANDECSITFQEWQPW